MFESRTELVPVFYLEYLLQSPRGPLVINALASPEIKPFGAGEDRQDR